MVVGATLATAAAGIGGSVPSEPAWAAATPRRRPATRLTMSADGMVRRDGATFRTGGVNAFQLVTNDYPRPRLMPRPQIDRLLARAVRLHAGIVRAHTLAASVGGPSTLVRGVSGTGPSPRIAYDQSVWDTIDYAVWRAGQLGLYLVAPFVDELGYYHGGKRHWVDFRRPGSVSMDDDVKAAGSPRQRSAENAFYTDRQITWDFEQYVRDWLLHVNPWTGLANKDAPALSIVQVGNELWTAAQDAPGWVADKAALIKSIAPTTLVMDSGTDGLEVRDMAWASPHVDILETHPYSVFGADDVARMARFAASRGKAFAVGEYPWSKAEAPAIERVVRRTGNIVTSAPWSLQNHRDLHSHGAPYGSDDVSLYVPGKNDAQRAAVARITAHHRALARGAATATSPASGLR